MSGGPTLIDRCVVGVGVESFSRRNTRRQSDTQRELRILTAEAAQAAGLDPTAWDVFPTGDGERAVLPAGVNLLAVVGRFVPALNDLLVLRNEDRVPGTKIRLRMAVHTDVLSPGGNGSYAGPALVLLSQLLDSLPVRRALAGADASALALILSAAVYEKVVLSGLLAVRSGDFARVEVDLADEEMGHAAYVHVPGQDMRTFTASEPWNRAAKTDIPHPLPSPVQAGPGAIVVGGDLVVGGNVDTSVTHLGPGTHHEAPR